MKKNKNELKCVEDKYTDETIIEWTKEFEDMYVYSDSPKCEWESDCEDDVISYSFKKYSYHLSRLLSLPQFQYQVIYQCLNCDTLFKVDED